MRYLPSARRGIALFAAIMLIALCACDGGGGDGGITIPTSDRSPPELSLGAGVTGGGPSATVTTYGRDATLALRTKVGDLNLLASGKDSESGIRSLKIWMNETIGSCASAAGPCSTRGPDLRDMPGFESTGSPKQPGETASPSSVMAQSLNLSSEIPGAAPPGGSFSLRWDIYATSTNYLEGTSQTRTGPDSRCPALRLQSHSGPSSRPPVPNPCYPSG